jgi:polyhydroxyalkanoate synthase subunit PhaC
MPARQADLPPTDPPTIPIRQGPRPLALHLAASLTVLLSSPAGLPLLNSSLLPWHPSLHRRAAELQRSMAGVSGPALAGAVDREMRRRIDRLLTGLERYRHHPYRRDITDPPPLWTEGAASLRSFAPSGAPVLLVPSLVNRGTILDLSSRRSLCRWLAQQGGLRPFLLDWGTPGALERGFDLTSVIAGRLSRAIDAATRLSGGQRPILVGYCMGGLLTLAAALLRPDAVAGLVLLATPWDFHSEGEDAARRAAASLVPWEASLQLLGELPIDGVQALFAALDPQLVRKKFSRFARLDPAGEEAVSFVALEDWLNDGVALPAAIARECLEGWYGQNRTMKGQWSVAGLPMQPQTLRVPTLALIPAKDRIVPPGSAAALARAIPGATALFPPLGHIGMIVSGGAENGVWQPLRDWLQQTAAGDRS